MACRVRGRVYRRNYRHDKRIRLIDNFEIVQNIIIIIYRFYAGTQRTVSVTAFIAVIIDVASEYVLIGNLRLYKIQS
jgi:hypothetical protein